MTYLLDANVFMTAANNYYAFDLAPAFWTWLGSPAVHAVVGSVEAVRDEVLAGEGDLVDWAAGLPVEFWLPDTEASLEIVGHLADWANDPARPYRQSAVEEFMASGDIRLIALAASRGDVVVTHETPAPESKSAVKIPDACDAVGVEWMEPFAAFRALGMRL